MEIKEILKNNIFNIMPFIGDVFIENNQKERLPLKKISSQNDWNIILKSANGNKILNIYSFTPNEFKYSLVFNLYDRNCISLESFGLFVHLTGEIDICHDMDNINGLRERINESGVNKKIKEILKQLI